MRQTTNDAAIGGFGAAKLQQLDAEDSAGCPHAAVERCDRNPKPARQLEINDVVSLQVVTHTEIDDVRRIKFDRKRLELDCYTRIKDDAFSYHVALRELP